MVKLGDRFVLGYKKGLSVDYVSFGIRMDKVSQGKKILPRLQDYIQTSESATL